ncbi:MAG TPA: hypothetical protein VHX37_01640 [Acidobacteriaceae bacterium]|nr:hypothetical protein [Acidobacteriaceae bacterium]
MNPLHIVVCGSVVPDPLQTIEPLAGLAGPALKNELLLPAIFDPWAAHALYEAAALAKQCTGSQVWLVSLGPKPKLQQVMMSLAQKGAFTPVFLYGPAHGFADSHATAAVLADAVAAIHGIDRSRLLLFGGWESASRGQGVTLQMIGERLGIFDQFQGVDRFTVRDDGSFEVWERIEGGKHLVSLCSGPPALFGWATGERGEPRNDPQMGMKNMRSVLPALQQAKPASLAADGLQYLDVRLPSQQRATRVVRDQSPEAIAEEIFAWLQDG